MQGLSMSSRPPFSKRAITRIVLDLLTEELSLSRGRSVADLKAQHWSADTRIDNSGLDLDSLERLNASAALNQFFHLHEYGAEDYLLAMKSVGEWVELVEQSLSETGTHITFQTSGSTGVPKKCTHAVADLMAEVESWAAILEQPDQIVSLVPSHHIYGTIWTALLPDYWGLDCENRRFNAASALSDIQSNNTLVIGTPALWHYVARSVLALPAGVVGVTSTAPMPAQLAQQLKAQRLKSLIEIYGSSETGGIGWRRDHGAAYTLLDHWSRSGESALTRISAQGEASHHEFMDEIDWHDERHLTVSGRRDGAVQIGGHNVFPEQIRQRLLGHADVADAAVRLEPLNGRLKAFIVPTANSEDPAILIDRLESWCAAEFKAIERPKRFAVGGALPRNAMGKPSDW
jgi:long-chain acyl-CoA synthetase